MRFTFYAYGHREVLSTHPSTIEITKETHLTPTGDCVIAVNASIGARDLPGDIKRGLTTPGARAQLVLKIGLLQFQVEGEGDPRLTLSHPTDFVIRKSGFICDRTLMIHANRSANDLPRAMVRLLQDPKNKLTIEISAAAPGQS